jgi:ribosomal-protein-alanine N-acetyltransferase
MFGFWRKSRDPVNIQFASSNDLAGCADIHEKCFSQNWATHTLASMLNNRGTKCLVAKISGPKAKQVGFLMYRVSAQEAEILTVAVDPDKTSSGIGSALLEEMIRLCLIDRLEEIFLEVDEGNLPALKIYKRLGFRKVGERKGYYNSGVQNQGSDGKTATTGSTNALIMRLDLSE